MIARTHIGTSAELLAEATEWRLHALLLLRPTPERREEVQALIAEVNAPALVDAARAWSANASEGAYLQLLGPGGLVPAREAAYRAFADPGWLLADIARYHEAFGFQMAADEPADHAAMLLDLVAYLFLKEAYARECDDAAAAETTRGARERFVLEHVVPVLSRLAARLDACGATEWAAAPRLLATRLPAPAAMDLPVPDGDAPACGACADPRDR